MSFFISNYLAQCLNDVVPRLATCFYVTFDLLSVLVFLFLPFPMESVVIVHILKYTDRHTHKRVSIFQIQTLSVYFQVSVSV